MQTLSGFAVLKRIDGNLLIQDNNVLTSLSDFAALNSVGGFIQIGGSSSFYPPRNRNLITVSGFDALTRIEGDFIIQNNDALTSISGFSVLNSVGGTIQIGDSPSSFSSGNLNLMTVSGFDALTRIEGDLFIQRNTTLTTISGFDVN